MNDDMTMWLGHKSGNSDRMQLGTMSVSGTYTGVPDLTLGVNVSRAPQGSMNVQVGVDMEGCDTGVAMDN